MLNFKFVVHIPLVDFGWWVTILGMVGNHLGMMQSCKNVSLVPQAQFLVQIWFLKICGKFCLNAVSNWSNSWYIFLLSKKNGPVDCPCYLYLHLGMRVVWNSWAVLQYWGCWRHKTGLDSGDSFWPNTLFFKQFQKLLCYVMFAINISHSSCIH